MRSFCRTFPVAVVLLMVMAGFTQAEQPPDSPPLTTDQIVRKLMAANVRRAEALRGYTAKRNYHIDYTGWFGHRTADMQVEVTYTAPDKKDFRIISQSGSTLLINRILLRLLKSESDAQEDENRKGLEVTSDNYNFALDQVEQVSGSDSYVLKVAPKGKNRYLYRGKIWVDARDFAVARMEGEPQKNFSMWASHSNVAYRWFRQDGFWLPIHTQSDSQVRMGGKITLTIDYSDYQLSTGTRLANERGPNQHEIVPSPTAVTADPP